MFTKTRIALKVILWRTIAFLITLIVSYIETRNIHDSGMIGIINMVVKLVLLYIYEIVWLRIGFGIKEKDGVKKRTKKRVCVKTTIWRTFSLVVTAIIVFIITRDFESSITISIGVFIVKTIVLFIYEFSWHRVKWGVIESDENKTDIENQSDPDNNDSITV